MFIDIYYITHSNVYNITLTDIHIQSHDETNYINCLTPVFASFSIFLLPIFINFFSPISENVFCECSETIKIPVSLFVFVNKFSITLLQVSALKCVITSQYYYPMFVKFVIYKTKNKKLRKFNFFQISMKLYIIYSTL